MKENVQTNTVWDTFAFRSLTSQGDPRTFRRTELAHRCIGSCAPFWNSLRHGCYQPWFFGQFQLSFPAQRSGSSPLRSWSRNAKASLSEKRQPRSNTAKTVSIRSRSERLIRSRPTQMLEERKQASLEGPFESQAVTPTPQSGPLETYEDGKNK
jgi:hypothetical protein